MGGKNTSPLNPQEVSQPQKEVLAKLGESANTVLVSHQSIAL